MNNTITNNNLKFKPGCDFIFYRLPDYIKPDGETEGILEKKMIQTLKLINPHDDKGRYNTESVLWNNHQYAIFSFLMLLLKDYDLKLKRKANHE